MNVGDKLFVVGAGGHAKVVVATARAQGWDVVGLFDDNDDLRGKQVLGISVLGSLAERSGWSIWQVPGFLAVGNNVQRRRLVERSEIQRWATILHPDASVDPGSTLGAGTLVCARAVVQAHGRVGNHSIVNSGAIVEHDCWIGDWCHLAPGSTLGGGVVIGDGVMLGLGSIVLPNIEVGAWSIVGAGAVVTRSVPAETTVAGTPARILQRIR